MPSNRLPRRLLYGELQLGQRPVGRPKLRYSDHIKSVLRKCNIPESQLEALAEDRFCGVWHEPPAWRILQQQLNKQLVIAVLVDMQRLQLLQLDLSALTVAEFVLRTSVSAVIFVFTYDRTTDNYISATSSSKSRDYYTPASKQAIIIIMFQHHVPARMSC